MSVRLLTKKGNNENVFNLLRIRRVQEISHYSISNVQILWYRKNDISIKCCAEHQRATGYFFGGNQLKFYILIAQSGDYRNERLSKWIVDIQKKGRIFARHAIQNWSKKVQLEIEGMNFNEQNLHLGEIQFTYSFELGTNSISSCYFLLHFIRDEMNSFRLKLRLRNNV